MVSPAATNPDVELPELGVDDKQHHGLLANKPIVVVTTSEVDENARTWSELSQEEKVRQLFSIALGMGCISAIPTAFFATITVVLVKT